MLISEESIIAKTQHIKDEIMALILEEVQGVEKAYPVSRDKLISGLLDQMALVHWAYNMSFSRNFALYILASGLNFDGFKKFIKENDLEPKEL